MKLKNSLKGFPLVEVLIVIIIVGILIAALLPRLTGSQQRARDTSRSAGVNQLTQAVGLLMSDHGSLAQSGATVCVDEFTDITAGSADLSDYLASLPSDPQSNHSNDGCAGYYSVRVSTDGNAAWVGATTEVASGGNSDVPAGSTLSDFQTAVDGDGDYFGAIARG